MATQLLAVAATAADSTDLALTAGQSATVYLKGVVAGGVSAKISLKDDAGAYQVVAQRLENGFPLLFSGPGTYRFSRDAGVTFGVFSA